MNAYQAVSAILIAFLVTGIVGSPIDGPLPSTPAPEPQLLDIVEDVIPDVMNSTLKVLRVNPVDRPAIEDSEKMAMESALYKIQSLLPAHRSYTSSKRMRKQKTTARPEAEKRGDQAPLSMLNGDSDKAILDTKYNPKRKHLQFLYSQAKHDGSVASKRMKVHFAPGAYPVYYMVAKVNGRFGKHPLKHFPSENDFVKYVAKNKLTQ